MSNPLWKNGKGKKDNIIRRLPIKYDHKRSPN